MYDYVNYKKKIYQSVPGLPPSVPGLDTPERGRPVADEGRKACKLKKKVFLSPRICNKSAIFQKLDKPFPITI
jgi:hypothetical protein